MYICAFIYICIYKRESNNNHKMLLNSRLIFAGKPYIDL